MVSTKKGEKSEFVRNVLREIGAISSEPPQDWKNQVHDALRKNKLDMHNVTIYQLRRKLMQEEGIKSRRRRRKGSTSVNTFASKRVDLTLDDIVALQKVIEKFGGLKRLQKTIELYEKIRA